MNYTKKEHKITRINEIMHGLTRLWMRKRDLMVLKKLSDPERADEIIKRMGQIEWRMQQLYDAKQRMLGNPNN